MEEGSDKDGVRREFAKTKIKRAIIPNDSEAGLLFSEVRGGNHT